LNSHCRGSTQTMSWDFSDQQRKGPIWLDWENWRTD